jgi:hypothetical protein
LMPFPTRSLKLSVPIFIAMRNSLLLHQENN